MNISEDVYILYFLYLQVLMSTFDVCGPVKEIILYPLGLVKDILK